MVRRNRDANTIGLVIAAHSKVKQHTDVLTALGGLRLIEAFRVLRKLVADHVADEEAHVLPALSQGATSRGSRLWAHGSFRQGNASVDAIGGPLRSVTDGVLTSESQPPSRAAADGWRLPMWRRNGGTRWWIRLRSCG